MSSLLRLENGKTRIPRGIFWAQAMDFSHVKVGVSRQDQWAMYPAHAEGSSIVKRYYGVTLRRGEPSPCREREFSLPVVRAPF